MGDTPCMKKEYDENLKIMSLTFLDTKLGDLTTLLATGILGLLNSSGFFTLEKHRCDEHVDIEN